MACSTNIREAFALFDRDGDGELCSSEAVLAIRACGILITEEEANSLPAIVPWNTFEQWMQKKLATCNPEAELAAAFKAFDRKGDGTLSTDELSQVIKTLGDLLTDEEVDQLIQEADPGKSGRINYVKFVNSLLTS